MSEWQEKLDELEGSLSRFPHLMDLLGEPADDTLINETNALLSPFKLPTWLEQLYRWRNGAEFNFSNLFGYPFNSIEDSLKNKVEPLDHDCGYSRHFLFPFLGVDDMWALSVLDYEDVETEPTILLWDYMDQPRHWFASPMVWIEEVIHRLEFVNEDWFTDDGRFSDLGKELQGDGVSSQFTFGGMRADEWPESFRQRAGITDYTISESELPPQSERVLRGRRPIPHPGPWDVNFWGFTRRLFDGRKEPKYPATIQTFFGLKFVLEAGTLSDHALLYGFDLDAVIWFRSETLDSQIPTIDKVRFPIR